MKYNPPICVWHGIRFYLVQCILAVGLSVLQSIPAHAQESAETARKIQQLQKQIDQVERESKLKLEALQRDTDEQVRLLHQQIAQMNAELQKTRTASPAEPTAAKTGQTEPAAPLDRFNIFGDFRLRYEANSTDGALPSWDRSVLRARLAARYELGETLFLGAKLVTGDPDNPRTSDVTIGEFDSDLEISLDQAYVAFSRQSLFLTGGQFAKPFNSAELVWDGDVNPQGAGGYYDLFKTDGGTTRFSAIYFIINQNIIEEGSDMLGGQFSFTVNAASDWQLTLNTAYYDYDLGLLNHSTPGGARGNTVTSSGTHYLSDYNLLDTLATMTYTGFGERWKVWFLGDYVKNLGAEVPEDSGYEFDLFVGTLDRPGHFLFHYGYAEAQTDAVLGLFSNDNITYPTNYVMHTISVDYAVQKHVFVGLTNYLYRQLEPDPQSPFDNDWVSRTRLNLYFTF